MAEEIEPSPEAQWLRENWSNLTAYDGKWIAVKGSEIIGSADRMELDNLFANTIYQNPLYALVWHGGF